MSRRRSASIDSRLWLIVPSAVGAHRTTGAPQRANNVDLQACGG